MNGINDCSYMTAGMAMPFCKGCGHGNILRKLDAALSQLKLDPKDVCLVTDIGCIGLADALFDKVHTVHTTHGRSTGFATGIAVADKVLAEGKLKTIVLIGDGGSMIGLLHIVNGALMNADLTVLVCNNFLFGMTGGQQSSLTPLDFITQTSPYGNIVPPLDICSVAEGSKAEFIARKVVSDKDLTDVIAQGIAHEGFSLIEILELCPEHATEKNELKGSGLAQLAENEGHKVGLLKNTAARGEFTSSYKKDLVARGEQIKRINYISPESNHNLTKQVGIIISGSAGERVQSSAGLLCEAALNCGLNTTQKNDNPVTQGSGFSLSEVIISPEEIDYTGVDTADVVIAVSKEGWKELIAQNIFERIDKNTLFIVDEVVDEIPGEHNVIRMPFRKLCSDKKAALGAIDNYIGMAEPFPADIFRKLMEKRNGPYEKIFKPEFYKVEA